MSNLTKRRKKSLNTKDDCFYTEEKKQLFKSHLIESKQIEYLKENKNIKWTLKTNWLKKRKKIKAINDENLIEKLISDDVKERKKIEIQKDNGECFNHEENANLNVNENDSRNKKETNNKEINKNLLPI